MWRRCVSYPAKARRPEKQKWILYAAKAYGSIWEGKPKPGGLPSDLIGGANPPDERKEGDANERYIFGLVPVVTLHCCPCQSGLSDFQGKEISRHYCNSDGLPLVAV